MRGEQHRTAGRRGRLQHPERIQVDAEAHALLAGSRDFAVEPIAAWTQRPLYYPDQRRFGTFMH